MSLSSSISLIRAVLYSFLERLRTDWLCLQQPESSANVLPSITIYGCCNTDRIIRPELPLSYLSGVKIVTHALFLLLINRGSNGQLPKE